jgi:hypothetical protein
MVLFWTGRGILVLLVFVVMAVAALVFTVTELSVPLGLSTNQGTNLTLAIAAALTALVTWPFGRVILRSRAQPDTLFWIDVRYWSPILAVIAVAMLVVTFVFRA